MGKTLTIDEAKARPLEDLLRELADTQEPFRVLLEENEEVEIQAAPRLKPLETLPGYVPDGWKDAIYDPRHSPGVP